MSPRRLKSNALISWDRMIISKENLRTEISQASSTPSITASAGSMMRYGKLGFTKSCREGATGHFGCDLFFSRAL